MQEKNFEALNYLIEKFQFLYIKKEQQGAQQAQAIEAQNIECDNPHERFKAPMVDVQSYPRLIEAIPSLETDFFRSPIPRKKKYYDANRIQMALATMTRKIDDYVHIILRSQPQEFRQLKSHQQEEEKQKETLLPAPADCVWHNICNSANLSNVTPNTANNAQNFKGISAKQLIPDNLNIFYEEKRSLILPQKTKTEISYGLSLTLYPHHYKRKMNRKDSDAIIRRRLLNSPRLLEIQQLCRGDGFQNRILDINMQDNKEKILHDYSISRRHLYAHSDTSEVQENFFFQWN
ncbi:hypothetical protein BB561_004261 [Smittium simulii]|uniref:Uncharacterized protein n=1 Tax=Smittium simulii TaxID=133385 RepID=A0A2T9YHC3_9FUNG|nr:hypothetical protein BB561_004261 [Smittium simulii]